jgi:hypothetical protein
MRTAITLARKHGGTKLSVVSGPEVSIHEQKSAFKSLRFGYGHDKFEYIELWTSDEGRVGKLKLLTPEAAKEKENSIALAKSQAESRTEEAATTNQNQDQNEQS